MEKSTKREEFKEEMDRLEKEITESFSEKVEVQNQKSFEKGFAGGDEEGYKRGYRIGHKEGYEEGFQAGRASKEVPQEKVRVVAEDTTLPKTEVTIEGNVSRAETDQLEST